jgi:hypothetical protein
MYKHSYGHFCTDMEAHAVRKELQESNPKLKFEVVKERRSDNTWKKYCVCVMVPSKKQTEIKGKKGGKKSQIEGETASPQFSSSR